MANYQSLQQRFNRPTSNINHALIDRTLREKQQTIDTNFGILQQTVDKTLGQDLIRESDREYLKEKVSGVLDSLDNTDSISFDSKKARFTIQDALSKASGDPNVLKQVANTKKIRKIQEFYSKRSEKGNINQQNFQYAYEKTGIGSYLENGTDDVSDFKYLEYVDVDGKLDDVARKLKAANPNEKISIQNPLTGQTVSRKVSMITPQEMRSYLRVQLNANDLKQLEIDGSMMYGMDDGTAVKTRDRIIANNNRKYSDKVSLLENYRDNGNKTKGEIDRINQDIKALGAEKAMFEQNMIGKKTAELIGGQQLIENKLDLFSNLYTKNGPQSVSYDNDYLKRMRDANTAANVSSQASPNISTITTPTNLPEEINPYQDSVNRTKTALQDNSNYLKVQFNSLSDDKKKLVEDTMEQIKNDPEVLAMYEGEPISNETLQLETVNRLGPNFFPPDVAKGVRESIASTKAIQDGVQETTSEFVKTKSAEQEVFDQLSGEETNLTMITPEGEVNMQKVLEQNGVTDINSYRSFISGNTKPAKQIRATLALQSISLTNDISLDDVTSIPTAFGSIPGLNAGIGSTSKIDLTEGEYRIMRQSAHDLTGESLEKTYSVQNNGDGYTLLQKNPNTAFAGIVEKTNSLYQQGRSIYGLNFLTVSDTDRTARNESSIRDLFSEDNYVDFASSNLSLLDKTVAGSNSIRIKGDIKKLVDPIYNEVLSEVSNAAAFDLTDPIDIYKKEDGSLFVSQPSIIIKEDGKQSIKNITGVVQANDVKKMTLFNQQISTLQKENTFKSLEGVASKVDKMTFIGDNREQVEGLNRLYNKENKGENMFRLMSSDKTARDVIFNSAVTPYITKSNEGIEIMSQFEDFVTNTQNYNLEFTKGIDSDYQVLIKNIEGENIGNIPLNNSIPVETFSKAFQGTPQVFLSLYSKSRVDKYMKSLINER